MVWGWFIFVCQVAIWPLMIANGLLLRRTHRLNRALEKEMSELEASSAEAEATTKQLQQLQLILHHCAVRSFMYQHLPFWRPWSEFSGMSFSVVIDKRDGNGKQ